MTSLLRTNGNATKMIVGCYQGLGVAPSLSLPEESKSHAGSIKDSAQTLVTAQSLQSWTSAQANAISPLSGLRSAKGIIAESRRYAHTDVSFPNFDNCRHESTLDANKSAAESEDERRVMPSSIIYGAGGLMSIYFGKQVIQGIGMYKSMAADQKALASIEIDLTEVPEGTCKTYEWRGKPVFVNHRTKKQIEDVRAVNSSDLRDPQTDQERVKNEEWGIFLGICTHLGCIPFSGLGDFDGYFCPCHGSHYDAAGRIRKGPAPLNLHVPEYEFLAPERVRVG